MSRRRWLLIGPFVVSVIAVASPAAAGDGEPVVFAGTGGAGFSGDGGIAVEALLERPTGVSVGSDGTVYIADTANHAVRAVTADGSITTFAGDGEQGAAGDEFTGDAPATDVSLGAPGNLAVGADGAVYIADTTLFRVFKVAVDGALTVVAGNGRPEHAGDGGLAIQAPIGTPGGLAVAPDGTLFVADITHHRIRAIDADGVISTVAGNGGDAVTAAGGDATALAVPFATSLAVGSDGALWIAGAGGLVQRLDGGRIGTVTVPSNGHWDLVSDETWPTTDPALNNVTAVAAAGDAVYVLDGQSKKVLRLDADKSTPAVIELPTALSGPLVVKADLHAYIVDTEGNRVWTAVAAAASPPADDASGSWWIYAAGGAALVVAAAILLGARRRSRR